MNCGGSGCHNPAPWEEDVLDDHDDNHLGEYPVGHEGPLMDRRPILCSECHPSANLGPYGVGLPGMSDLSNSIHNAHKSRVDPGTDGCYTCHPGPVTQANRGVMSTLSGVDGCEDCHGNMTDVSQNPNPWLNEPRCDDAGCHIAYPQDKDLYRLSREQDHGSLYCAGCHDSPHAIAPSVEPNDAVKFIGWQGHAGTLQDCYVCHASQPSGSGPHGLLAPTEMYSVYLPIVLRNN
jgi:hypothetical protein